MTTTRTSSALDGVVSRQRPLTYQTPEPSGTLRHSSRVSWYTFQGLSPVQEVCPKPVKRPLSRRRVRVHRAARSRLWVTTMDVSPCETCNRSSRSNTRPAVVSSKSPVGSSASRSRGPPTNARANATRCCSPPESSPGRWSLRSSRSTSLSQLDATASDSRLVCPRASRGIATFSRAVNSGNK